jgi:UDP-N-acetylmuramoyl-tripeptide--D-alanyl-D-alanine ligase
MLTVNEIKKIVRGRLLQGDGGGLTDGVSIDSRTVRRRKVFIAIQGDRLDGHDFVPEASRKGAAAVIVSKKIVCPKDIAVIHVKDTTKALGQVAAWHRRQFDIPVIAVTGSAGKTSTKEMTAAVLGTKYKVLKNFKTENNQFGVPLTLLKLDASYQMAVVELGTSRPGDIRWLARISRPTVAVFTNIGDSHLEGLKNKNGVFREKLQMVNYMAPRGVVVYNGDDKYLQRIPGRKRRGQTLISYGCRPGVDYQAGHVDVQSNRRLEFTLRGHAFTLRAPAAHNVYNSLAAIFCGLVNHISYADIAAALSRYKFHEARSQVIKAGPFWLIDDTYNANPVSFAGAVDTLNALRVKGKKIIVCGDMLELGPQSKGLHRSVGEMVARSATGLVLTVGRQAKYIAQGCQDKRRAVHCRDIDEVCRRLKEVASPGDAILVKGSRGARMERVVEFLKKELTGLSYSATPRKRRGVAE